ncbi:aldo/keto reductase [Halosegnis marinus]|uniref:Aldo/keto reductase n=1 Tax=Halosegnis marinus TaxID=3034023 RepID=A0ABD5ZK15_9EURY|nr:aldo/keto reductase [Halosegnis sp. DT85]
MDCLFVGAGAVAAKYAEGLAASPLRLAAVCDRERDRAERLAGDHGAAAYADLDAMLAAEDAALVVNLTGHAAHAPVTERCLDADRHVFSEKPAALSPDRAAGLIERARDRELAFGCAPLAPDCDAQRHAATLLGDGRLGRVRFAAATANVGRVDRWHDRPDSFLAVGPLYDGAVYPLSVLVAWFGRVERVRTADAVPAWPEDAPEADAPTHWEATLAFADGPTVALRASYYVDHRSREFYGVELHGDDGTLYLDDAGAMAAERDAVTVRGGDREPVVAPHPKPRRERRYLYGPERLARAVAAGRQPRASARRSAHVVAVCAAVERAAAEGGPVDVEGAAPPPAETRRWPARPAPEGRPDRGAIRLPPIGFGCSRYRDGAYVEPALGAAVDAGYRLFDTAELYGNEHRLGDALAGLGRDGVFLFGKAWNTNHGPGHLRAACEGSLAELGVEAFDCYALHWPDAWEHTDDLRRLSERPVAEQEALTFPTEGDAPVRADVSLADTWRRLERLREEGLTRTLGVCNVTLPRLARLCDAARVPPAVVQVERHPYRPRTALVEWCHRRGIRVMAHSPLSAPGLLDEPAVRDVAERVDAAPAAVLLAWHRARGVVPIPSTTDPGRASENLAAARLRLDGDALARLDALADPSFER